MSTDDERNYDVLAERVEKLERDVDGYRRVIAGLKERDMRMVQRFRWQRDTGNIKEQTFVQICEALRIDPDDVPR